MSPLGNSRGPCCVELPEYVLLVLPQVGACPLWAIVGALVGYECIYFLLHQDKTI
jgi:hypothetical protein